MEQLREVEDEEKNTSGYREKVQVGDIAHYIVFYRSTIVGGEWSVPSRQLFHRFVNLLECDLLEKNLTLLETLAWSNMWGDIGLLGLRTTELGRLRRFRSFVETFAIQDTEFMVYPREGLLRRYDLSVVLRDNLKSFDERLIA
jgi:hypothetical protein